MKRFLAFAMIFALFSIPALAGKNSQSVTFPTAVKVGSAELAPGDYNVAWTGSGADVQVTFTLNGKMVATVPAKLMVEGNKNEGLELDSRGGVDVLETIRMRNMTLRFAESSSPKK